MDQHQLLPLAVHARVQTVLADLGTHLLRDSYHIEQQLFIEIHPQIRALRAQRIRDPSRPEIVVHRELGNLHIVTPTAVRAAPLGQIRRDNRGRALRKTQIRRHIIRVNRFRGLPRCSRFSFRPDFSDLGQCLQCVVVHQAIPIRRHIQDKVTICLTHRNDVIFHEHLGIFHRCLREIRLPEPGLLNRETRQRRKRIALFINVLPRALFIRFDIGVEQCVGRIFG